jgi:hypothetical protein
MHCRVQPRHSRPKVAGQAVMSECQVVSTLVFELLPLLHHLHPLTSGTWGRVAPSFGMAGLPNGMPADCKAWPDAVLPEAEDWLAIPT